MRTRFLTRLTITAICLCAQLTGCQLMPPTSNGRLSVPQGGTVRVTVDSPKNQSGVNHWNWTIIGERNWDEAVSDGSELRLQKSYPMNTVTMRQGCFTWMVDVTVRRVRHGAETLAHWEATLHGSNGDTVVAQGDEPLKPGEEAVVILQKQDTNPRLPVVLSLAQVAGKPIVLRISE